MSRSFVITCDAKGCRKRVNRDAPITVYHEQKFYFLTTILCYCSEKCRDSEKPKILKE